MDKKNIYIVSLDKVDYDEYEGFVVVASTKKRATELMVMKHGGKNVTEDNVKSVEKIGTTTKKEGVVFDSYCGG